MKALKKPYVAIMVMALCILLSIVIGQSRRSIYEAPIESSVSANIETEETTDYLYDISTYGTIRNAFLNAQNELTPEKLEDTVETEKKGISGFGVICIIVLVFFVLGKLKDK